MTMTEQSFEATLAEITEVERGIALRVQLRNAGDRAAHYIAEVRALDYDPTERRLTVRLNDEGRIVHPGIANIHPKTQFVDPGAEAELTLTLPAEISKLAASPVDNHRRVRFEKQRIADAEEVVIEVGWSDTPYYDDPRPPYDDVMPSVQWQQFKAEARMTQGKSGD